MVKCGSLDELVVFFSEEMKYKIAVLSVFIDVAGMN